jgi:hypothetical protein
MHVEWGSQSWLHPAFCRILRIDAKLAALKEAAAANPEALAKSAANRLPARGSFTTC